MACIFTNPRLVGTGTAQTKAERRTPSVFVKVLMHIGKKKRKKG
jgi:hypothetical protein